MIFIFKNVAVDLSSVEIDGGLDASRWAGRLVLTIDGRECLANWAGAEGSSDGAIFDLECEHGADEAILCALADDLAEEISRRLGDPCSPEERRDLARRAEWFDEGSERAGRRAA